MNKRSRGNRTIEAYQFSQRDIAPRGIKPIEDHIERTPEYNAFMKNLEEFHKSHGTTLQKEPVLGSKKLDLYKIYRMVIANGGCEKICSEKAWKKICEPFNFPHTCTNSAYVMKNVYIRFLEAYELENHWGKPVPYGGLPNRPGPPTPQPQDQFSSTPQGNITPPKKVHSLDNMKSLQSLRIMPSNHDPITPIQHYANYDQPSVLMEHYIDDEIEEEHDSLFGGGNNNRVLLALKSQLPNEIDWAFEVLIQLSEDENIIFYIDKIPGLIDVILTFVAPFYKDMRKLTELASVKEIGKDGDYLESTIKEYFSSLASTEQLKRVMQIFLIFRNFSFLEFNSEIMATYKPLRRFLIEGLNLPEITRFSELRYHCLETVENMCKFIVLKSGREELLLTLPKMICSSDSALIIRSIRALTRLASNENNVEFMQEIDPDMVERLVQFLFIDDDEEMIVAVLDWFYQYTTCEESAYKLAQIVPCNFVRLLISFLRHGASDEDYLQNQRMPEKRPFQIRGEFENFPEPYRTIGWLKRYYEDASDDGVLQTEIWYAYRDQFMNSPTPMLPAADVIKNVNMAFPDSSAIMTTAEDGIKRRKFPEELSRAVPLYRCRWTNCNDVTFTKDTELYKHVFNDHVNTEQECHWMDCKRFSSGSTNRIAVISHVKTHFPVEPDIDSEGRNRKAMTAKTMYKYGKNNGVINHRTYVSSDTYGDALGIPLTASLILRNLSTSRKNLHYFVAYEQELTEMLANCVGLSKHLAETLSNLRSA
ncbi:15901_t:CDS:2 [Funneliformis caledonium]|uniref:15901_t:CDS:1 n=1 Tax=Funneliformis caledonium TaxID=1117310 RepID=A0A9N9EM33_9GLOM|nr:15901_t:CDS:2 [Funneliformis caledonium]